MILLWIYLGGMLLWPLLLPFFAGLESPNVKDPSEDSEFWPVVLVTALIWPAFLCCFLLGPGLKLLFDAATHHPVKVLNPVVDKMFAWGCSVRELLLKERQ